MISYDFIRSLLIVLPVLVPFPFKTFGEDLLEIYQQALINDPLLQQEIYNRRAVLEERPQALATLLPNVNLSAGITGSSSKRTGSESVGFGNINEVATGTVTLIDLSRSNSDSQGYSLSLSQPVFRQDRYYRLKQADKTIKLADVTLISVELNLLIRVSTAYFNVLSAIDNLRFAEAEKRSLYQQLEQTKERFDVGLTTIIDIQEAQAGFDRAFAEEIRAINEIDNAREELREITGHYFDKLNPLSNTIPLLSPDPDDIEIWSKTAATDNLDVVAAIHAVDIARDEIKIQNAGHLPTIDLNARRSYNENDTSIRSENTNSSISLEFSIPIYSGGLTSSLVKASQERLEQKLEELEQVRRRVHREARQAYLGIISEISQINAMQQAVLSSEVALEATRTGFEIGTRTAVDVVLSERATFQAKRDLARSRYDYIINSLNLKLAAGILTINEIEKINEWLN